MALILNIDTAVQSASVCLADGDTVLKTLVNPVEKDSAAWLHIAIETVLKENKLKPGELNAIAVSAGPGSYTGLRVGMATAKGLCYALSLPLITINTLQMMAAAAMEVSASLLCPMIDARRMEVFTALYNKNLNEVHPAFNLVLTSDYFNDYLDRATVAFFGNGSKKAADIITHPSALFVDVQATAANMVNLSSKEFDDGHFSDLAYSEPFYGKDFHSPSIKKIY